MIFEEGEELELYCIFTDELTRNATVTESTERFTKIKEFGSDKEEIIMHDRMLSLLQKQFVRKRNANEDSSSKDSKGIYYGGRFWTTKEFEDCPFDEDNPIKTPDDLIRMIKNSACLRNAFYTTRDQREKFEKVKVEGIAGEIYRHIHRVLERDNLLSDKLVKELLADPKQVEKMNEAFLEEGVIGIPPLLIGGDEKKAGINIFAEGSFPLFSKLMDYLKIRTIQELKKWLEAFNDAAFCDVLMILIDRCPFLMDPCIMNSIKNHKDNEKVKALLSIVSAKTEFWNRTVMPETFRVIKDFLHDDSVSAELDFCSDAFPEHFTGFSDMLAKLREVFPIDLYMKINHVCQQLQYRKYGIPITIFNRSFDAMDAFHTLFGEVDTDTSGDEFKVEQLLHTAGVSKRVIDTMELDAIIWTIEYKDNNVEPKPQKRSKGEVIEMVRTSRYPNSAVSDESRAETAEQRYIRYKVTSAVNTGKPALGYAMGRTEEACLQVFEDYPDHKPSGPRTNTKFDAKTPIFIIEYNDNNVEPKPEETTYGEVIEMVHSSRYQAAATSDKPKTEAEQKRSIQIRVTTALNSGKPAYCLAMGRTEEACLQVFEDYPDHKPSGPRTTNTKFDAKTPIFIIEYNDNNVEPKPEETTYGEVIEMVHSSRYQAAATSDKPKTEAEQKRSIQIRVTSAVNTGKPAYCLAMGRTKEACLQVFEDYPDHYSTSNSDQTLFIIDYKNANQEQEPRPIQTTKRDLMLMLQRSSGDPIGLRQAIYNCRPYKGFAIGFTAEECLNVFKRNRKYKPRSINRRAESDANTFLSLMNFDDVNETEIESSTDNQGNKNLVEIKDDSDIIQNANNRPDESLIENETEIDAECKSSEKRGRKSKMHLIKEINKNDVLCGRGGAVNSHSGNKSFRKLVKELKPEYQAASKKEKSTVAAKVVSTIRKRDPPGRFLKKDEDTGFYTEISNEKAIKKARQAFTEGGTSSQKQICEEIKGGGFPQQPIEDVEVNNEKWTVTIKCNAERKDSPDIEEGKESEENVFIGKKRATDLSGGTEESKKKKIVAV